MAPEHQPSFQSCLRLKKDPRQNRHDKFNKSPTLYADTRHAAQTPAEARLRSGLSRRLNSTDHLRFPRGVNISGGGVGGWSS